MHTILTQIVTDKAPAAIGPYSAGICANGLVFISGQLPIDPSTGVMVEESLTAMTIQSMNNIKAILEAAGSSLEKIVKTTIFIKDLSGFNEVNEAYGSFFKAHPPARSCVQVSALPKNAQIEIEAIAVI